jgi:hypothetical protein
LLVNAAVAVIVEPIALLLTWAHLKIAVRGLFLVLIANPQARCANANVRLAFG